MLSKKILSIAFVLSAILLIGCNKDASKDTLMWGKTNSYDKFLWKEQVPDTLKRTLCFDFNDDAQNYMTSPLKLGIFKKDADGHLSQVKEDEMELFVNGAKLPGNVIEVQPTDKEIEVGVVFNPKAENKVHYWYIRPLDMGGLERINDQDATAFGSDDAIKEIKVNKRHVMNPLAEGLMWFCIFVLAAIVLWFLILKHIIFPTFRVTRIQLSGPEPYFSQARIKGCRMCVLTAKAPHQNWFNKVFTGEIKYVVNNIWSGDVVITPRDKKSVRIAPAKGVYTTDARFFRSNDEHVIVNENTKAKTNVKIS